MEVKTLVLTGDGVNCENETKRAFEKAGANCVIKHINDFSSGEKFSEYLKSFHILALPGGFSFGDELGSGKVFALKLKNYLGVAIEEFIASKKPIIGICNGFQVLTKLGVFNDDHVQVGLARNHHGRFIDKWSHLKVENQHCIWLKEMEDIFLPIRHGEGRFVGAASAEATLQHLKVNNQVVLTYNDNPNGSLGDIAGVTDKSGVVFGLMPHPEAAVKEALYPGGEVVGTLGLKIFENAVNYIKKEFLS